MTVRVPPALFMTSSSLLIQLITVKQAEQVVASSSPGPERAQRHRLVCFVAAGIVSNHEQLHVSSRADLLQSAAALRAGARVSISAAIP